MSWLDSITDSLNMNLSKLRGDSEGQISLVWCSPQGGKESDATEQLNNKVSSSFQMSWFQGPFHTLKDE